MTDVAAALFLAVFGFTIGIAFVAFALFTRPARRQP